MDPHCTTGTTGTGPPAGSPSVACRGLTRFLSAVLVVVGGCAVFTRAAEAVDVTAEESYPRPADGVYQLEGRGYGHGRGLSQWGAHGAARLGVGYRDILAAYYPGTVRGRLVDGDLRVLLTAGRQRLEVVPEATGGVRVAIGDAAAAATPLPTRLGDCPVQRWRVHRVDAGLRLEGLACGGWLPQPVRGRVTVDGPISLTSGRGRLRLVLDGADGSFLRDYRGAVTAVVDRTGALRVVNTVPLEGYLRSVVAAEMSASWPVAALAAQAVAARTYASWDRLTPGAAWDTCDSTACQVYPGVADVTAEGRVTVRHEWPRSDQAVADTAGEILTYSGRPAFTQFGAANGGRSVAAADPGQYPYLVAWDDPWDGAVTNSAHAWGGRVEVATLERAWPAVGRVRALRVRSRSGGGSWGGRVESVGLTGTSGSVVIAGTEFRTVLRLRSTWWRVTPAAGGTPADPPQASTDPPQASTDPPPGNTVPPRWTARPPLVRAVLQAPERVQSGALVPLRVTGLPVGATARVQTLPHAARSWRNGPAVTADRDGAVTVRVRLRSSSLLRVDLAGQLSEPVRVSATVGARLRATSPAGGQVRVAVTVVPPLPGTRVAVYRVGTDGVRTRMAVLRTSRTGTGAGLLSGLRRATRVDLIAVPLTGAHRSGVESQMVGVRVR